jgi:integrase
MKPPASLVWVKGKDKWYVQITVPPEDRPALNGKKQIRVSTGTSDKKIAESRKHDKAQELYDKLPDPIAELEEQAEELVEPAWQHYDLESGLEWERQQQAMRRATAKRDELLAEIKTLRAEKETHSLTVSELSDQWFESGPYASHKTLNTAKAAIADFINDNGDVTIAELTAKLAYDWAEELGKTKGNQTVRKKIGLMSKCLSYGERKGLVTSNPFYGLNLSDYGTKTKSMLPFTNKELHDLFSQKMPDSHRLLLEILITTGMRLDEAALLDWDDIKEEDGVVYFDLTEGHKQIKNIGSRRKVPVSSVVTDKLPTGKAGQMFPEFKRDADGKAQAPASKALMRYVRVVTDNPQKTVHSLRGTFKDKLRDAGVTKETNDFITGHASGDVSGKYGSGPSLKVRQEAIDRPDWSNVIR